MKVGTKVKINKKKGTIIKTEGNYGLIKFDYGSQIVFNLNNIKPSQIIEVPNTLEF